MSNGGLYLFDLVDECASQISLFFLLFLQSFICSRYLGCDKIQELVKEKTGICLPLYLMFSVKYICPPSLLILTIISVEQTVILFIFIK